MNNQIPEDSGETQFVFQTIEMQFQHRRNPYLRGGSWKRTSQDRTGKDKSSKEVEDTNKNQGRREFPQICQFLLVIHSQLQPYSKTIKRIKEQKGMEMGGRASEGV